LLAYHPTNNCKIVEDYKNKTIEELSEEYHKMFDDWQEKYIIGPHRKQHEKRKREREKYKEEYENEIDFINMYLQTTTEEHDNIDKIQIYKLLREYRR